MSVYKQFLSSDIISTPFEVNKSFVFKGNELTASNVGIDRFFGLNLTGSFNPNTDPTTGIISTQYSRLVYRSVKQLYYSNYLSSSYGDNNQTASLIPGRDREGDRYVGPVNSTRYDNSLQTTLTYPRHFVTESYNAALSIEPGVVGVISIPSRLFGEYIQPGSFRYETDSGSLRDDGEGNILDEGNYNIGNIFYPQGIIVLITGSVSLKNGAGYASASYATSSYGFAVPTSSILNLVSSSNVTCSFSSSLTIYETQFKCTIRENEFNLSLNPTLTYNNSGSAYDFVTSSYFAPYITTIGLYNEKQELLATAKLAQPLMSSPTTDTNIILNLDR